MIDIDWNSVLHQLLYDAHNPLLFNNGFFVYFLVAFILLYYLFRKNYKHRAIVLTVFSLYFFYKASGAFVGIVILSAFFNYGISNLIFNAKKKSGKGFFLFWSVIVNLGVCVCVCVDSLFLMISCILRLLVFVPCALIAML